MRAAGRGRRRRALSTAVCGAVLATGALSAHEASSAAAEPCLRPGVGCVLGIPYANDGEPVHELDAYFPTGRTARASVVLVHGGYWGQGSSDGWAEEAAYFAENGFAAFSINYTKWKKARPSWPQVQADVEAATAWVMANAERYHGDGARVGVIGGSSGAHLAGLVATAGPERGVAPLATVSWSGPMNLTTFYRRGVPLAKNGLMRFLGCNPNQCPDTYADASPVSHVSSDDGAMLLFHSTDESIPVKIAREMRDALSEAGVPHELVLFRGSTLHSRGYICEPATLDGQTWPVIDQSVRWLGARLAQPTVPTGTFCDPPGS